jgi:hypothetical protein
MLRVEKLTMKAKWSILALYEDPDARQLAVQFCDGLMQRFWAESGFDLSWCDWKGLEHPVSAEEAAKKAREADLIIVALSGQGMIAQHVKGWLELAVQDRGEREGVLVGLPDAAPSYDAEAAVTQMYLRKLAHQAGMDYLTAVPQSLPTRVPESTEAYNQRATQVTSVLEKILSYTSVPPPLL